MQNDIKIGIIVGIVVVVAAAVLFVSRGKDNEAPGPDITPPPDIEQPAVPVPTPEPVIVEPKLQPKPEVPTTTTTEKPEIVVTPPQTEIKEPLVSPPPVVIPEPEVLKPRYHTVAQGDSLYTIAEQYYGHGKFSNAIFEANRTIIKDPDKLQAGWKLRIPYPDEIVKK
jgi:nucleoid-associated protein YgaU